MASIVIAQAPVGAGLDAAQALVGAPYSWGGRLRKGEGLDCMAVVLAAAERASGCGWKSYPVNPTELVERRLWGTRVAGLDPIATKALDVKALEAGDVLLLVGFSKNPAEPAIGAIDGSPVWVWHVGLYVGAGRFLVGDHHEGQVVELELVPYLSRYALEYAGVFVTRGPAQKPSPCRRHSALARPKGRAP